MASANELAGWQALRVVKIEGSPQRMLAADIDGDGRKQLVVINTRLARLDFYRWLPATERTEKPSVDADRPNELPLAPEWSHSELDLEELPLDVVAQDLDADKKPELIVVTSPSNKVLLYKQTEAREWKKTLQWDLLAAPSAGKQQVLLVRPLDDGKFELLISCDQGIQSLRLDAGARPAWLSPRESRPRLGWQLLDLDGDRDLDLVEWSPQARQTIRWFECREGALLPAQVLYDQNVQGEEGLAVAKQAAELLLLGGSQEGLLRRYVLGRGEENELGRQDALPLPGGAKALWTGMTLGDKKAIVIVDTAQPRLRVQALADQGWAAEQIYPINSGVRAVAPVAAQPGTLLLWTKDASDLHVSKWDGARMTYPQTMPQSADVADRSIIALGTVGTTAWWVQRVGADLDLYVWENGQPAAKHTRFAATGLAGTKSSIQKLEKVFWLGGQRLLVQPLHSEKYKLLKLVDDKPAVSDVAHFAKADLAEFGLYDQKGPLRVGRMTEGVLQWLNDDLQPTDQIMLAEGQRMTSFVPLASGEAWALEQGGAFIHLLKPDTAGILRIAKTLRPPTGLVLTNDAVLGMMLVDQDRIVRLTPGRPWELSLRDSIDGRVGRPSGVKEATIHRILVTDVTGDGQDEVVLCDDKRHQLTVLGRTDKALGPMSSWTVFEDKTYPYGGSEGEQIAEPRAVVGLDADGDASQDLALLCHDRLLLYMAKENP